MLLPYTSYLRMYEPVAQLSSAGHSPARGEGSVETTTAVSLAREQQEVLRQSVLQPMSATPTRDLEGGYMLRRHGQVFICPVDLALRSWMAAESFDDVTNPATRALFLDAEKRDSTRAEYATWRAQHPTALPHIRQATWGVPRTWFLLVAQEERETYQLAGGQSARFRTPAADARRRLLSAYATLNATIDDTELMEELSELGRWLAGFAEEAWLEVDYAGAAGLLGDELAGDRSAYEVTSALRAIARRDFATAGEAYRQFIERWRAVAALERAN